MTGGSFHRLKVHMKLFIIFAAVFFCALASFAQSSTTTLPRVQKSRERAAPVIRESHSALEQEDIEEDESGEEDTGWSVLFESFNEVSAVTMNTRAFDVGGDADDIFATNLVAVDYEVAPAIQLGIGVEWETPWGLNGGGARSKMNDSYVQVLDEEFFTIGNRIESESLLRLYVPTGEDSRDLGQVASVRYELSLARSFRAVTVKYLFRPQFYAQKYLAYLDADTEAILGTRSWEISNLVELEWRLGRGFSFHQLVGLRGVWYYGDANYGLQDARGDDFLAETALGYEISEQVALRAGLYQEAPDLHTQVRAFSPYRDDEANYYLSAAISF